MGTLVVSCNCGFGTLYVVNSNHACMHAHRAATYIDNKKQNVFSKKLKALGFSDGLSYSTSQKEGSHILSLIPFKKVQFRNGMGLTPCFFAFWRGGICWHVVNCKHACMHIEQQHTLIIVLDRCLL